MPIRHLRFCALAAPLLLAGCGMPVGVQVASMLADGVSLLTTEKTLTDHGISAATGDDCAVWRGVRGEDICRDDGDDGFRLADAGMTVDFAAEAGDSAVFETPAFPGDAPGRPAPWATAAAAEPEKIVYPPADETLPAAPPPDAAPVTPVEAAPVTVEPVTVTVLDPGADLGADPIHSPPAAMKTPQVSQEQRGQTRRAATPTPKASPEASEKASGKADGKNGPRVTRIAAEAVDRGGVFYVIGSYRRLDYAERFAAGQRGLDMVILAGELKGRAIYRVAVGPVAPAERHALHGRLKRAGHPKTWALTLKAPRVALEVAALD